MLKQIRRLSWLRHLGLGLVVCALMISLSSFRVNSQTPQVLKVATEPTFPPFEMQSEDGSGLQGFDIDIMNAIGEAMGVTIQFEGLPFDGIIPALQSNTIDAAISGITITSARAQSVGFSSPYFKAGLAIAVQENNTDIESFDDLTNKRIAVQIGTTGAMEANKIPNATTTEFDSAVLALQELVNGKVDAVVNDGPVTLFAIKEAGLKGVKVVGELVTEEFYGIALPKNSPNRQLINYGLFTILENGAYQSIYQKWFAGEPLQLPLIAPAMEGAAQELATSIQQQQPQQSVFIQLLTRLPQGALLTVLLTTFSVFFGMIGGSLIAFALISPNKLLRTICQIYVEFFRGTPMLVQLFIIYFGLPALFQNLGIQWSLDRFPAAIIALSLNVAAYLAEIIRGGIQSIDQGQWEACQSLGMSPIQTMQDVIFPQAFRRILPPLGNEFITLIKDTSLTAVIGFVELFRQGQLIVASTYQAFEVYIVVALFYLLLTSSSSFLFKYLEKQMNPLSKIKKSA
ncbi:MAG: ABC transporter permease subunit [Gomphosphaeria aponina SAG 52.96 = DSM 107014]|uniref:ABC transporter permease subunit n=1 Tax=Gomphosphaeria aponina SAG 52.96 = DSM 107014 TaxID=1521640 RepID=A0A941GWG6_9CHRO|nr:ABC transporter permease subunit [Gomphosphaeria aponina SAG 52.96 = DSM 107014]